MPGTQLLFAALGVLVASGFALAKLPGNNLYITAPLQVLLGSSVFISLILLVVLTFARLGLYDRAAALGLPDGSVRALIALILLIIFIIFANVVFGQLKDSPRDTFSGLTQEQVAALPGAVVDQREVPGSSSPTRFEGRYLAEPNQDASALGQQVVSGLLTLVAAVSAFYFGSSSVAQGASAMGGGRRAGPGSLTVLRPSRPIRLTRTDDGFEPLLLEVGGSALSDGGVSASVEGDAPTTVVRGTADTEFTYTPSAPTSPVKLRFTSSADPTCYTEISILVPDAVTPPVVEDDAADPVAGGAVAPAADEPGAGVKPPAADEPEAGVDPPAADEPEAGVEPVADEAEPMPGGDEPAAGEGDEPRPPVQPPPP